MGSSIIADNSEHAFLYTSGHMIDLYSDAFRRLAPLSEGALHVTVSW